jgi:hypothetical protein
MADASAGIGGIRGYVCYRTGGQAYKFVWFQESKAGVYIGMYGKRSGIHYSYHTDGHCHFTNDRARLLRTQKEPIADIRETVGVMASTHRVDAETMQRAGELYRPDPQKRVGALPNAVRLFAWLGLLVSPVGGAALLQPGPGPASGAAIPLAAITGAADKEKRTAFVAATTPRPEDDLRCGRFRALKTTRHETTIHETPG